MLHTYRVLDESPHWLYSQKRYKEAQTILEKIASWNNCSDELTVNLCSEDARETGQSKAKEGEKSKLEPEYGTQSTVDTSISQPATNQCLQIVKSEKFLIVFAICALGW